MGNDSNYSSWNKIDKKHFYMNGRHILDYLAILKTGNKPTPCNNVPTPAQNVRDFSNSSKI
jgi:hypothetical protein